MFEQAERIQKELDSLRQTLSHLQRAYNQVRADLRNAETNLPRLLLSDKFHSEQMLKWQDWADDLVKKMGFDAFLGHDTLRDTISRFITVRLGNLPHTQLLVGARVRKVTGDSHPCGTILSAVTTLSGKLRFIVELDYEGLLHIYSPDQLERLDQNQ
jgi:hypothetical protein